MKDEKDSTNTNRPPHTTEYSGRSEERKHSMMGRRRFAKVLSSIGLSGSALQLLSKDAVAKKTDNPKDEMVIPAKVQLKNPKGDGPRETEVITETVPYDKWAHVEAANNAMKGLARSIEARFGDTATRTMLRTNNHGLGSSKEIVVKVATKAEAEQIRDALPTSFSGSVGQGKNESAAKDFPVLVEQETIETHDYYDSSYNSIPGGCKISGAETCYTSCSNPEAGEATSYLRLYNNSTGQYQLAQAGHSFESNGTAIDRWFQPDLTSSDRFGSTWDYRYDPVTNSDGDLVGVDYDAGLISSTEPLSDELAGKGEEIAGYYTISKIRQEEGNSSWTVTRQGMKTGRDSGYITGVDSNDFFTTTANADRGDSGGPYYRDSGQIITLGLHSYSPAGSSSGATGMHIGRIFDQWDVTFV